MYRFINIIKNGAVLAMCVIAISACSEKKKSSNGATQPPAETEATCIAKSGYQWTNNMCVLSTAENNQAMCQSAGRTWNGKSCDPAAGSAVTQTITQVASCSDTVSVSGSLSCLDSRTNELETHIRGKATSLEWLTKAFSDLEVIRKNYTQLRSKNITESSNFAAKSGACLDLYTMRAQSLQLYYRVKGAKDKAQSETALPFIQNFNDSVAASRKAIGCI